MMKKIVFKIMSCIILATLVINMTSITVVAEDGKFVLLNISGYNDEGEKSTKENNVFYIKNNILYAPIRTFEEYTMYNYDEKNNAFVRIGQNYKNANSKAVLNYDDSKVDIFCLEYQKEYDIDFVKFGETYFFPLAQMAAYLKSSVVYINENTISIINSGVSICDALYNYNEYDSCLDYFDIKDDIFVGNEFLTGAACVLGYFGETVFSFKVSNLMGEFGDYKKYSEILTNAVTNNDCYEQLFNNGNLLSDVLGITDTLYNEVYKKTKNIYNMSSNCITTMFEDHKELNSFGDDSPFDNYLFEEQKEIDKINSLGKYFSKADSFIDTIKYYYDFYNVNQDNKDAIELIASLDEYDTRAAAFQDVAKKYGNDFVESVTTKLYNDILDEITKDSLKKISGKLLSDVNKVKLATSIVNTAFKALGFDLSDNSGYNIMLADQLKSFILKNLDDDSSALNTQSDFNNIRLTYILGMLVDIESYKMGNKLADKYESSGLYDKDIESANKRLALLYMAKGSEKYDTVEGIKNISSQNNNQIKKLNFNDLTSISESEAINLLKYTDDISLMNEQIFGLKERKSGNESTYYYSKNGFTYNLVRDEDKIKKETFKDSEGSEIELGHTFCVEKVNNQTNEKELIINDYEGNLIVTDQYIYYSQTKYTQGTDYNDCYDGVDYVRTDLYGQNKEILYHDEYVPFGTSIGGAPTILVTNDYLYVSKHNIVRVNLENKNVDIVCDIDVNELTGSDWINLDFVYDDTYYFTLIDNQESEPDDSNLPDFCDGFFKYNENTGLDYIIENDMTFGDSFWSDNGDGTKSMKSINNYKIKLKGLDNIDFKGEEKPEKFNFNYKSSNPFSEKGIYFVQGNGSEYFYSFDSGMLELL